MIVEPIVIREPSIKRDYMKHRLQLPVYSQQSIKRSVTVTATAILGTSLVFAYQDGWKILANTVGKLPWQSGQRLEKVWRMWSGEEAGLKHRQRLDPLLRSISFQLIHLIKKMCDDGNFNLSTDTEEINEKSFLLHIEVSEIQSEIKGASEATVFELDQQTKTQVNCNLDNNDDALTVKWPSWKSNRGYRSVYWEAWNETPPKVKERMTAAHPGAPYDPKVEQEAVRKIILPISQQALPL